MFPFSFWLFAIIEVWERFSAYTFTYLLPLFTATSVAQGGLGWSKADALSLSGIFSLGLWSFPILGGLLADRYLGALNSLVLGAIIIICGQSLILFSSQDSSLLLLYFSLFLVALGTGFFKPCITALVGEVFRKDHHLREKGYSFYYICINIGILLSGILAAPLALTYGFHFAFGITACGMLFGLTMILIFFRKIRTPDITNHIKNKNISYSNRSLKTVFLPLLFVYGSSFLWALSYFIGVGGMLLFYIEEHSQAALFGFHIPLTWFPSLSPLLLILLTYVFAWLWTRQRKKSSEVHILTKMQIGLSFSVLAFLLGTFLTSRIYETSDYTIPLVLIISFYALCTVGEILTCPLSYALIGQIVPKKHLSTCQAICFVCYGVGGYIASLIGSHIRKVNSASLLEISANIIIVLLIISFAMHSRILRTIEKARAASLQE